MEPEDSPLDYKKIVQQIKIIRDADDASKLFGWSQFDEITLLFGRLAKNEHFAKPIRLQMDIFLSSAEDLKKQYLEILEALEEEALRELGSADQGP